MANQTKAVKGKKLSWYEKAPFRFLAKPRDVYVNGMNRFSPYVNSINPAFGVPAGGHSVSLPPPTFNAAASSSASDDHRELIRVNSAPYRQRGGGGGLDLSPQNPSPAPRSRSVGIGIGRIDEDKVYESDEDDFKSKPSVQARSRSRKTSKVLSTS